ncbi:DMT family transporter [Lysinibacillus fusiformis]|uniref:DMT family transporter n=1 Tax=Lysinibacillus fusiformis TaxID=28031 RepID=UPI000891BB34|nr:DMT family transporter [Lysinibacillus fusiformis]SCX37765.1 EamA domain-containing membrane protein RarD [Lysinibacillus fusiformis]SDB04105.1 EamA domain-containing membrane protein RarD [Lysinibacillus fusiformis]SFH72357.1 EamA domain-containing membrane protein RarD [Lysinibacillus fusiformis]SFS72387.1 EamA domain-containing membrane protein RarD [Lysinibacillus fusiformis]
MSGKLAFVLSMIIFGAVGVFAKYIPLFSSEIAFWMSLIGACFLIVIFIYIKESLTKRSILKNKWRLILSSVALCGNWIFLFQAYKETTIANAALSYYFAPVLVICLSPIVLKEKLVSRKILYVCVAIFGLFLIVQSQGTGDSKHFIGIVYGLIAACFYTALTFTNKCICGLKEPENTLAAFFLCFYILGTTGFQVMTLSFKSVLLLMTLGIVHAGVGFLLFFWGMSKLKGQSIAILS